MKRLILVVAAISLVMAIAAPAQAGRRWYTVTVNNTGVNTDRPDVVYINATSTDDSWEEPLWFVATGNEAKSVLAVALSAWSMGTPVMLTLDDKNIGQWAPCYGIFTTPLQQ